MNWSTSVVSSISTDTEPTVLVTFENAKYIFNVGENTSRTFLQTRNTWRKARAVFLSRICANRTAGLPGFLMTMSDSGLKNITIAGPDGLDHFIASLRLYTRREDLSVTTVELPRISKRDAAPSPDTSPMYQDENITVFAVQAFPTTTKPPTSPKSSSLKRKRSGDHQSDRKRDSSSSNTPTSPGSSPKPSSPKASEEQPETPPPPPRSLIERFRDPEFKANHLDAADASAWRKLTIEHMFGVKVQGRYDVVESASATPAEVTTESGEPNKEPSSSIPGSITSGQPGSGSNPSRLRRIPSPANYDKRLPVWKSGLGYNCRVACSYIIHGPKIRGKFDAAKAAALGLKPGPLRGKVAKGETVEITVSLPDGTETTRKIGPDDCLSTAEKPIIVCIVDCPSVDYVNNLISSPTWKAYHPASDGELPHKVHLIYHLVGKGVLQDKKYKKWMSKFGDDVHHFVAAKEYCPDKATFTSVSMSQLRLHNLDNEMFPLPHFSTDPVEKLEDVSGLPPLTQVMDMNHHTSLRPLKPPELMPNERDLFHDAVKIDPLESLSPSMKTKFDEARTAVAAAQNNHAADQPGSDVVVIPLGTSSAAPTKYRNVSSTLVRIPGYGSVLLDCGEGTYGQLARHFGPKTKEVLRDLRCIFISHIHADHHVGLCRLLAMWKKFASRKTLYLVASRAIHLYLLEYSDLEDIGLSEINRINADAIHWRRQASKDTPRAFFVDAGTPSILNSELALPQLRETLGMDKFIGVDVAHRTRCFGLVMQHKSGWSLVFSGDTMPCQNLVEAGKNATLLIHEATMSDEQVELAAKKAHSTCGQAIDIAKQMQAQNVLLTHFSARHPKMPPGISTLDNLHVGVAFDQLRLPLNQVWKLAMYQDAITESFSDMNEEEGDVVTMSLS